MIGGGGAGGPAATAATRKKKAAPCRMVLAQDLVMAELAVLKRLRHETAQKPGALRAQRCSGEPVDEKSRPTHEASVRSAHHSE